MRKGLQRCGKSCRLRWPNYLRPGIKRSNFTPQEEEDIIRFHSLLGNRLAAGISSRKHGLDRIKNVILSEPRQAFKEDKLMISSKEEEEEVNGCFMEIDDNLISMTSLEELLCESTTTTSTTTGFMAAFDDCSLVEPYDVYQYDFYHEADDQLDLFLEFHSLGQENLS
ncbi:unnamed protein product [Brassica oleracea var. botrytis]|uniref:HTH myb-type domain-containing protein n=2 Tax=Brassica TaxID=3705 RepID=A0A0D3CWN7_BRAOL|nr:unnamed protein product [Brassica napus]